MKHVHQLSKHNTGVLTITQYLLQSIRNIVMSKTHGHGCGHGSVDIGIPKQAWKTGKW